MVKIRTYQQQRRWLHDQEKREKKQSDAANRRMRTMKIDRRGKWLIEKGLATIKPSLNRNGIDLETALELVRDLRNVRKPK